MKKRFFSAGSLSSRESRFRAVHAAAEIVMEAPSGQGPMHNPPLEPRDEAVFLLTAAAEIEHALMVQYLYAAYSLRLVPGDPNFQQVKNIQDLIIQIAREEMGHLITIQNLLHLVGGPLNFNREHSPYASEIYPFRFKLEPLTLDSLSKYVIAESPFPLPEDLEQLPQINEDAKRSNDGVEVNHVGPIFARLEKLFNASIRDEDFRLDTATLQAKFDDWGFEPRNALGGEKLIIGTITSTDVAEVRTASAAAVHNIGQQGEAYDPEMASPNQSESHFERFFDIYNRFKALPSGPVQLTWPVAENPNTTTAPEEAPGMMKMNEVIEEAHQSKGRINNPRAKGWAHLFNLRYRMLLMSLSHFLRLNQELYSRSGPTQGDRTPRGLLLIWTFNEMRRLKKIAGKLVQMPKDDPPGDLHAGPPFELPYTLNLPERDADRWRLHLDISRAAVRLIRDTLQPGEPAEDGFLTDLVRLDEQAQVIMQSLAKGDGVPEGSLPTDFEKVVTILEEAVRGFDIVVPGAIPTPLHGNFWDGLKRDDFIKHKVPPGAPEIIKENADHTFDPDGSPLIRRLKGIGGGNRMPRFRPPVPDERIGFVRQWVSGGCQPLGDPGIKRERNPELETVAPPLPPIPPGTQLSFEADIKNLFRASPDRDFMLSFSGFDLHKYEDVRDNAERIFERINDGTMPCDGSWQPELIAKFRKWIDDGMKP